MATLYTNGDFIALTPTEFNSYSLIRYTVDQPDAPVLLGLTVSGTVDFSARLGAVAGEIYGWTGADKITSGSGNDTLWGDAGNDSLYGGAGDDLLVGDWDNGMATGIDWMYGGDGNDELIGGLGNDTFYGGNGDDFFSVGETSPGNDGFFGGAGYDQVSIFDVFGNGLKTVALQSFALNAAASVEFLVVLGVDLTGTAGNDSINLSGTTAYRNDNFGVTDFAIDLLGGSDSVTGGASNETVTVADGNDHVNLGAGDDTVILRGGVLAGGGFVGGLGFDRLILGDLTYQGSASPHLTAVTGLGFVIAGGFESLQVGRDVQLTGTAAADVFTALGIAEIAIAQSLLLLAGNDRYTAGTVGLSVDGGTGNDSLIGGTGDDTLIGGIGNDSLVGGEGSDSYGIDSASDLVIETGSFGRDSLLVSLTSWTMAAQFENMTAVGPGGLNGVGNASDNSMTGGAGSDSLSGLDGDDFMTGAGLDTLVGGAGNDTYIVTGKQVTIIELADGGTDRIWTSGNKARAFGNVEDVTHDGTSDFLGIGSAGANLFLSGDGNDTLRGMGGNDTFQAALGVNRLVGGAGDDTYHVYQTGDAIVERALDGTDQVYAHCDVYVLPEFVENLAMLNTAPDSYHTPHNLTGTGNGLDNYMTTYGGDDVLYGLGGDDTLVAGGGDDSLFGGNGDDTYIVYATKTIFGTILDGECFERLDAGIDTVEVWGASWSIYSMPNIEVLRAALAGDCNLGGNVGANLIVGNAGNDTLRGELGHDTLTGGAGADSFVFAQGSAGFTTDNAKTITDFTHGQDHIQLDYWSFSYLPSSSGVTATDFKVISGGGRADADDHILYDRRSGEVFYDTDGRGGDAPILFAVLANLPFLTERDFELIF